MSVDKTARELRRVRAQLDALSEEYMRRLHEAEAGLLSPVTVRQYIGNDRTLVGTVRSGVYVFDGDMLQHVPGYPDNLPVARFERAADGTWASVGRTIEPVHVA